MKKISLVKKTAIILFLGFLVSEGFVFFSNNRVFASPPAPAPKCYVKGVIQNVRFEKAYELPCVKTRSCPTDTQLSYPNRYYVSVNIHEVSFKDGDTRFQTCASLYPLNTLQEIFINEDKVIAGDSFKKSQQIEGVVSSFWGYSFDSYQTTFVTPKPCTQDENPCNSTSCSYDPEKCSSLPQTTSNPVSDTRYGHAKDYSWVSGQLQYYSLEGGCWSIKFSDQQEDVNNYWGIFGLEFDNPQMQNKLKEGSFVTIKGKFKGQKFSMACPQNMYTVSSIENKESLPETPPIGGPPLSIFEKIKLFFDGMLDTVRNFFNGVKSTETKTKYKY
jgi:hypothetical protein